MRVEVAAGEAQGLKGWMAVRVTAAGKPRAAVRMRVTEDEGGSKGEAWGAAVD